MEKQDPTSQTKGIAMKASEKKNLLKHINKDSKEFKQQLREDQKLKQEIKKSSKGKK